jgi:hypothetical protein
VDPEALSEHVPSFPARLHASHWPVQAVLQHTPSMQFPDTHCREDVHVVPLVSLGTQEPPEQYRPATHWVSAVQVAGQVADEPEHTTVGHEGDPADPAARKASAPQAALVPEQRSMASQDPADGRQRTLVPRRVHVPLAGAPAAIEQASHGPPLQAVLQQTPSAQNNPAEHCVEVVQGPPRPMGSLHAPPWQV